MSWPFLEAEVMLPGKFWRWGGAVFSAGPLTSRLENVTISSSECTPSPPHRSPQSLLYVLTDICETDGIVRRGRKKGLTQNLGRKEITVPWLCLPVPSCPLIPLPILAVSRPALPPSGRLGSLASLHFVQKTYFQMEISESFCPSWLSSSDYFAVWNGRAECCLQEGRQETLLGRQEVGNRISPNTCFSFYSSSLYI